MITPRVTKVDDSPALEDLFEALGYPAAGATIRRRIARLLNDGDYESWVAEERGSIVGFAAGHLLYPVEDDQPAAQLIALVTASGHRGAGAGSSLCREFEKWAGARGAGRVLVNSGNKRVEAHAFYERRGYSRTGVRFGKDLAAEGVSQ